MRQPVLTCVTYADRNHVRFRSTVPVKVSTKSDTGCRHRLLSLSLHSFNRGVPRDIGNAEIRETGTSAGSIRRAAH